MSLVPALFANRMRRRYAAVIAAVLAGVIPVVAPGVLPTAKADVAPSGYWLVASDGGIFSYGAAKFFGSTGGIKLNQPITGMAPTPSGNGYWLVASDGGIFSYGDARFFGSTGAIKLNQPITGMAPTPSGNGYWLVASDGGIFSYGDARFFGSTGGIKLNQPITGMAPTPSGNGYWLVASDGGIFSYGDARFFGSTGAIKLNQPITGMAPTASGNGYSLVASDGGIFSYGDAPFLGSAPSRPVNGPRSMVAMVRNATGAGYWQASAQGELLAFGDAANLGGPASLSRPIVGMAAVPAAHFSVPAPPGNPTPPTTQPVPPPPGIGQRFSSTARQTWGTPVDLNREDSDTPGAFPYAQMVKAVVEVGNKVYVGGEFANLTDQNATQAAPATPFLTVLDVATGAPIPGSSFAANASPDGPVDTIAASADGRRLYVGGRFNRIGGKAISRLAALDLATGEWDPTFEPPTPNAFVRAMTVSGGRLYIGGSFTDLSGVGRPGLAALDANTGALIEGFVPPQNHGGRFTGQTGDKTDDLPGFYNPGDVVALAVSPVTNTLMVGGNFLHFGTAHDLDPDHERSGLVALDATSGALSTWQPENKRPVFGLAVWPGDGRTIFTASGGAGGRVQAFLINRTGNRAAKALWSGYVDGDARGVAATTERVYLVGHFDHETKASDPCLDVIPVTCPNGTAHRHLVAFEAATGVLDPSFTAQANTHEGPYVAFIGARNLYVGGNFSKVGDRAGGGLRFQRGLAVYPAI